MGEKMRTLVGPPCAAPGDLSTDQENKWLEMFRVFSNPRLLPLRVRGPDSGFFTMT